MAEISGSGFNFVIYKRKDLSESVIRRIEGVNIVEVVKQLIGGDGVVSKGKSDDVAILRGTTNFTAAKVKRTLIDAYKIESFLTDHVLVNGISNNSPTGY
jgi:hypothetical protein